MKESEHHLYGHIKGSERYNVARWCEEASGIIKKCTKNNIPTVVVGGTGMYFDKLINGLVDIPSIPEGYKKNPKNF
jgi:tRNA dimethylallyltransferase